MKTPGLIVLMIGFLPLVPFAVVQERGLGAFEIVAKPEDAGPIRPLDDEGTRRYLAERARLAATSQGWAEIDRLDRAYGYERHDAYHGAPGEDPNDVFRRVYPYPGIRVLHPQPEPDPLSGPRPGAVAVEAWTMHWPEEPTSSQGVGGVRSSVWRWDVPVEWRGEWPFLSDGVDGDRYGALAMVMRRWIDGKETASGHDPVVFCFDALSGLRWRSEVPVRAAVQEYAARTGEAADLTSNGAGGASVKVAVSRDGSCVWAVAFWARPRISILCAFGENGALHRTVVLPDRLPAGALRRCPVNRRLLATFQWRAPGEVRQRLGYASPIDESYLIDSDGRLVGRFVDDRGLPVSCERASDSFALGAQLRRGGEYLRFLYRLP